MSRFIRFLAIIIFFCVPAFSQGYTFRVRHDHNPWGECLGEMTVSPSGIAFESEDDRHDLDWGWVDIQSIDRQSVSEFTILTYDDRKWLAGKDRPFSFKVIEGEGLSSEVFALVLDHLRTPVVDRVAAPIDEVLYEVPVRHLHTFGGCEGMLRFGRERIVFASGEKGESRTWRIDTEITGIWSSGIYELDIVAREWKGGGLSREREFRFQLKEPLDEDFYFRLRREVLP
jgi:hypothetical protein